jgi:hypothetical protein
MTSEVSYRALLDDGYNPRGPDGQGWNRLAIHPLRPTVRCILRPTTRQAALDTARGMARLGVITAYGECTSNLQCSACSRGSNEREKWQPGWLIREDSQGRVWLLGNRERGWASFGYCYPHWEAIISSVDVPMLKRHTDEHGFYWTDAGESAAALTGEVRACTFPIPS